MEERLASKPGAWQRMRPALGVSFAVIGLSAAAFGLAAGVRTFAGAALPISTLGSLLSLAAVALVARRGRKGLALAAGSVTLLAWVPVLVLGALRALSAPIATTEVMCGMAQLGLLVLVPLGVMVAWTILAPVATVTALVGRRGRLLVEAVAVAVTAAGMAVAFLGVAASRWPAPDAYLSTLRTVPLAQGSQAVGPWAVDYGGRAAREPIRDPDYTCDLTVQRRSRSRTVSVLAGRAPCPRLYAHVEAPAASGEGGARDLLVIDGNPTPPPEDRASFVTVGDDVLGQQDLAPSDVPHALGPPRGWVAGGVAGALVALAALLAAWRVRRRARSLQNARDAVHAGDGWVTLRAPAAGGVDGPGTDGAPRHVPALVGMPAGPVMVVARRGGGATAYRDDGRVDVVLAGAGTKAEALAGVASMRLGLAAFAIAAVLLTQAVLWAARLRGLM